MSCLLGGRNSCGNKLLYFRVQLQEEGRTEARLKLYNATGSWTLRRRKEENKASERRLLPSGIKK
jgi:hypothetical protein